MELQLVKNQWLDISWWPLRFFIYFLLIVIKDLKDLRLELGRLHLQIVVVLEYEHVTVAGNE